MKKAWIVEALLVCFDKFHNPRDVNDGQIKAIREYVPNYEYPKSEKWFVTADLYPQNLKKLFKAHFKSPFGETCLIDKLFNTNEILQKAKNGMRERIMLNANVKFRDKIYGKYSYKNVAMELLRQQVISDLLRENKRR